jgi:iron complex outermembrane receptor protein
LSDIPGGASVIDQQTLLDRGGAATVSSLLAGQAGVRFLDTSSPINSEISIRASPTARHQCRPQHRPLPQQCLYRGGTAGGRSFTRLDLFDPGRVEVLRGTQCALRPQRGGWRDKHRFRPARIRFQRMGRRALYLRCRRSPASGGSEREARRSNRHPAGRRLCPSAQGLFYNPDNDRYFDRIDSTGLRAQLRRKQGDFEFNLLVEGQRATVPAITYQVYINPSPSFPRGYYQPKYSYDWNFAPNARQDVDNIVFSTRGDLGNAGEQSWLSPPQDGVRL